MEEPKIKTPRELEDEYKSEVVRTYRKIQLVDFVHYYYEHCEEMTFNQIVDEFRKIQ